MCQPASSSPIERVQGPGPRRPTCTADMHERHTGMTLFSTQRVGNATLITFVCDVQLFSLPSFPSFVVCLFWGSFKWLLFVVMPTSHDKYTFEGWLQWLQHSCRYQAGWNHCLLFPSQVFPLFFQHQQNVQIWREAKCQYWQMVCYHADKFTFFPSFVLS